MINLINFFQLIQRKPVNRLGLDGPQEVKGHPWLKDFPWTKLYNKELESPYMPNVFIIIHSREK